MNPGTLVIRADATIAMGTGHVTRCLALAQAWLDSGGVVIFAAARLTPAIVDRLKSEGMEIADLHLASGNAQDAHELAALARERRATWVVVDGYRFDSAYQRRIKDAGLRLLFIDDTGQCGLYCADIVLNQNAYATEEMYFERFPSTKLLLGPNYALLRREFTRWREWRRGFAPVAQRLLITMGGSDPENCTARIIRAAQAIDLNGFEITVAIGGSNPHVDSLYALASRLPRNIRMQVDVGNMAELMACADLAISAAGSTCYELALLQVPMLLLALADNQVPTARALANAGAAIDAGCFVTFDDRRFTSLLRNVIMDRKLRRSLAQRARRLVDGLGAHRVCEFLHHAVRTEESPKLQVGIC